MGNPVVHWELLSKDPAKMSNFYEKVFAWKFKHMPEMNYRLVDTGGEGGINGGIMKPEHEGPWPGNMTLYIDVVDLASYCEKVAGLEARSSSRSRSPRHGRVLAIRGSRRANDGTVEDQEIVAVRCSRS